MGFANFIGGVGLCILAVLLGVFGIAVMIGLAKFVATGADLPLGIGALVVALVMFLGGWYSFEEGKPDGTINVHQQ
jgi:hypothetical protein